jgi:hypothetical protein
MVVEPLSVRFSRGHIQYVGAVVLVVEEMGSTRTAAAPGAIAGVLKVAHGWFEVGDVRGVGECGGGLEAR